MIILHKTAIRFLTYGLFAVLCHGVAVLFFCFSLGDLPAYLLVYKAAPMLEHTLMSLCIVIAGGSLINVSEEELKAKK